MSAAQNIFHNGVLKAAGVVHVGSPMKRAALYYKDAGAYGRSARKVEEAQLEALQRSVKEAQECAARSYVASAAALVEWVNS